MNQEVFHHVSDAVMPYLLEHTDGSDGYRVYLELTTLALPRRERKRRRR